MNNLIRFIINFHSLLLFIIFETIAIFLSINNSDLKTKSFMTSANAVSGFFNKNLSSISNYLSLPEKNKSLQKENESLLNFISIYNHQINKTTEMRKDFSFSYTSAEVIKNSVFNSNNFITLDRGSNHGIKPNMAVMSPEGAIGVTAKVSNHYTTVISILNKKMGISGKLKKSEYFGSITWDGKDYRYVTFNEIPNHVDVKKGDTVVTSGFSSIFPKDIIIGFVESKTDVKENNFLSIKVKLNPNFKNLRYVYVIENTNVEELKNIEEETIEEFNL